MVSTTLHQRGTNFALRQTKHFVVEYLVSKLASRRFIFGRLPSVK